MCGHEGFNMPSVKSPTTALMAALAFPSPSTPPVGSAPIKVLAYGDSLTRGCSNSIDCNDDSTTYPFARSAQEHLEMHHPGLATITAIGHRGWLASQMAPDLVQQLNKVQPQVVMITAGGNDLFHWFKVNHANESNTSTVFKLPDKSAQDEIIGHLKVLHAIAHAAGAKTIAGSYPVLECVAGLGASARRQVLAMNERIFNESGADAHIDLARLLPNDEVKSKGWQSSDKIHFTKVGSRELGLRIAPKLAEVLAKLGWSDKMPEEEFEGDDIPPTLPAFKNKRLMSLLKASKNEPEVRVLAATDDASDVSSAPFGGDIQVADFRRARAVARARAFSIGFESATESASKFEDGRKIEPTPRNVSTY